MTALLLDSGALIAAEKRDRGVTRRLAVAAGAGMPVRTSAAVTAQVWRGEARQAVLAALLRGAEVLALDESAARDVGMLLKRSGTKDVVDAALVALARTGDVLLTSDPADLERLCDAAGVRATVLTC